MANDKRSPGLGTDASIVEALTTLSAYRAIDKVSPLATSNPLLLPETARTRNNGGVGPRMRLLVYGDAKGVSVHTSMTDSPVVVRPMTYANLPAFEIVTTAHGTEGKPQPTFESSKLRFEVYTSLLVVLKELVGLHKLPLEWAACWLLQRAHRIRLYDSYVVLGTRPPVRLTSADDVLVALEGRDVAAYLPGSIPRLVNTEPATGSATGSAGGEADAIPVPVLFIRRSSKSTPDGDPRYYACSGEDECERAIRVCHYHIKEDPEVKMRIQEAGNIARLVQKLLATHLLMPLPYLHAEEGHRAAELLE